QYTKQNFFLCSLSTSGVLSEPLIIWDAENKTGLPAHFVTPLGETTLVFKDQFGYFYGPTEHISGGWEWGAAISKRANPNGPRIYRNDWQSEESWRRFDNRDYGSRYYLTWDGDYYTIHATDAGMVLTKYTLQPE
ncbi:hypothetical protein KKB99_01525, partial [bacterium]|nr:hypothetical protein [bacterium]MBU1024666.1 hypothetical protein [bacterium]